jgi:hypothetical protein
LTCAVKTALPEATEQTAARDPKEHAEIMPPVEWSTVTAEPEPEAKAAPGRQERTAAMDIPVEMAAC